MEDNKVTVGTIARTAAMVITIANTILTAAGKNPLPFSDTEVYAWISDIAEIVVSLVAWWKNNSFTKSAIQADGVLKKLKEVNR